MGFLRLKNKQVQYIIDQKIAKEMGLIVIALSPSKDQYKILQMVFSLGKVKRKGSISEDFTGFVNARVHPLDQPKVFFAIQKKEPEGEIDLEQRNQKWRVYSQKSGRYETLKICIFTQKHLLGRGYDLILVAEPEKEEQAKLMGYSLLNCYKKLADQILIVNLDKNQISIIKEETASHVLERGICCYTEKIKQIMKSYICLEDQQGFQEDFSLEALKAAAQSEDQKIEREIRVLTEKGECAWLYICVGFYLSDEGEQMANAFVRNVNKISRLHQKEELVQQHYDQVSELYYILDMIVDGEKNRILWNKIDYSWLQGQSQSEVYSQWMLKFAKEFVCMEDRTVFLKFFSWFNLKVMFENQEKLELVVKCRNIESETNASICYYRFCVIKLTSDEKECYISISALREHLLEECGGMDQQLRNVYQKMNYFDVIYRLDYKNNCVICMHENAPFQSIDLNLTLEEFIPELIQQRIYVEDRENCEKFLHHYLREDQKQKNKIPQAICRYRISDGSYHLCFIRIVSFQEDQEKCDYFIVQDLTHTYGIQQVISPKNAELAKILKQVGYTRIWVDCETRIYHNDEFYVKLQQFQDQDYGMVIKELSNWIYEEDREWFLQELDYDILYQKVQEGVFRKQYRVYYDHQIRVYQITGVLSKSNSKEKIFFYSREVTQEEENRTNRQKRELLLQKRYYDDIIRQYEERIKSEE